MIPICRKEDINVIKLNDENTSLRKSLSCSSLFAAILDAKDLLNPDQADKWLDKDLDKSIEEVDLGPGLDETLGRFREMKNSAQGSKVLVYGDYDVDGISSTVLAVEFMKKLGFTVYYYIPNRQREGYGVHLEVVKKAISGGFQCLFVVDCGSKDVEAIKYAKTKGMEVFVFDHHSVDGDTIDLDSFVNPQRGGDVEAKSLCATAVLWCWLWKTKIADREWLYNRLDLVALATVADCMNLGFVNRSLVSHGIKRLQRTSREGLLLLCSSLGLNMKSIDEEVLAMKLNPCLNAAGRLDIAELAVAIMLGEKGLSERVSRLVYLNDRRRDLSSSIAKSISRNLDKEVVHVMYDEEWPIGLLSAIASRLCHSYGKAFALASDSGDLIRGTLRVPEGANAVDILSGLDDHLAGWGGHPYAAGFVVNREQWPILSFKMEEELSCLTPERRVEDVLEYDPRDFDMSLWEEIRKMGPFGQGNELPLFSFPRRGGECLIPMGKRGLHGRIDIGGASLIAFNGAKQHVSMDSIEGWLYRPHINEWRGRRSLQFIVEKIIVAS